ARGHVHLGQLGPDRVADPGQHVSDRVGHVHRDLPSDLPARLDHARDVPGEGELAKTDAAQLELAQVPARAPALAAARVAGHAELRLARGLGDQGRLGHFCLSYWFCCRNGMPRYWRSSLDSSSVRADVTKVTFMPRSFSTLA